MKKKILVIATTMCLSVSLFSGCGKEEETIVEEPQVVEEVQEVEEEVTEEVETYTFNEAVDNGWITVEDSGFVKNYYDSYDKETNLYHYNKISNTSEDIVIKDLKLTLGFEDENGNLLDTSESYVSYIMPHDSQYMVNSFDILDSDKNIYESANLIFVGFEGTFEKQNDSNTYDNNEVFEFSELKVKKDAIGCNVVTGLINNNSNNEDSCLYVTAVIKSDNEIVQIISGQIMSNAKTTSSFELPGTELKIPDDVTVEMYAHYFAY